MRMVICSWCQTVNDFEAGNCLACGAPLDEVAPEQVARPVPVAVPTGQAVPLTKVLDTQDLRKAGDVAEKIYTGALGAYSIAWRALGEALAIGIASFILGLAGGATRQTVLGIVAGVCLGALVGATTKNFWLTILGAPLGALLGAAIWLLPWALGAGVRGVLYTSFGVALLGAVIGRRSMGGAKNRYERLRPWLGAAGGFLFALLGALLGLGLDWVSKALAGMV
jgi:hypothetical protein